jgi:hypothetical protein
MFELDVISDPGGSLAPEKPLWFGDLSRLVDYDITLVKPSLLFAERVNLFSFRMSMLQRAKSEAYKMRYMSVRILPMFLRLVAERNQAYLEELGIDSSELPPQEEARTILDLFHTGRKEESYKRSNEFMDKYKAELIGFMRNGFSVWRQRCSP